MSAVKMCLLEDRLERMFLESGEQKHQRVGSFLYRKQPGGYSGVGYSGDKKELVPT